MENSIEKAFGYLKMLDLLDKEQITEDIVYEQYRKLSIVCRSDEIRIIDPSGNMLHLLSEALEYLLLNLDSVNELLQLRKKLGNYQHAESDIGINIDKKANYDDKGTYAVQTNNLNTNTKAISGRNTTINSATLKCHSQKPFWKQPFPKTVLAILVIGGIIAGANFYTSKRDTTAYSLPSPKQKESIVSSSRLKDNSVLKPSPDVKPSPSPLPLPYNGQVFKGETLKNRNSKLTIDCSKCSESTFVKLKNAAGNDVFSFFVRAGDSATVSVPTGFFYVYFAQGRDWYGVTSRFGEDTYYSKDDDLLDLSSYKITYTLYPVADGNFSQTQISEDEF